MKIAEFDYVDLKGKESHRVVLLTSSPSNKYSGIDITGMDEEDAAFLATKYEAELDFFKERIEQLKAHFDLKHNFRQFLETGMTNLVIETE